MNREQVGKVESGMVRGAYFISPTCWFSVEKISETVNVEPNYVWQQKKPWLMGTPNFPKITWGYELPTKIYNGIDIPTNEILEIFWPLKDVLVPFAQMNNLECTLDVELNICEDNLDLPVVCELSVETMKKLCELNTTFQITHHFHYQ
jgi:hypothetical protein